MTKITKSASLWHTGTRYLLKVNEGHGDVSSNHDHHRPATYIHAWTNTQ